MLGKLQGLVRLEGLRNRTPVVQFVGSRRTFWVLRNDIKRLEANSFLLCALCGQRQIVDLVVTREWRCSQLQLRGKWINLCAWYWI
jgi:hypothetical protein